MGINLPIGHWDARSREFSVAETADGLVAMFPEAPQGYEARLVEEGDNRLRMQGGPFPAAELVADDTGGWSLGGHVPLTPLDRTPRPAPGAGLTAPPLDLEPDELAAFVHLWARVDHPASMWEVDLDGHPCHRFVHWLMESDLVMFHGSNDLHIQELHPARRSTDFYGGAREDDLVYGTPDGVWSMFFAVLDRSRMKGTIRNGIDRFFSADGDHLDLYQFSIPRQLLEQRPFTSGALYLLPRDRFECLPLYPGGPASPQWACREKVRPLARLSVAPDDFPFLDQIGAHDDGAL